MSGLLMGVKIVDLTIAGVGPWASMVMGALGATVIKVERPEGDLIKTMAPRQGGLATTYIHCNLNKLGVTLDLTEDSARRALYELVREADVFLENMRPGAAERLGCGYEKLAALNPRLIYGSFPGWGASGPMKSLPAVDPIVQAFSGAVATTGSREGLPEFLRYYAFHDLNASWYVVASIMLGLIAREKTGAGVRVDSTQVGASMAMQLTRLAEYFANGKTPSAAGTASTTTAPNEAFRCANGKYLAVAAETDAQWRALCAAVERNDLADNPLYATNQTRVTNQQRLSKELRRVFAAMPSRWWAIKLEAAHVPFGPFNDFEQLLQEPEVLNGEMIVRAHLDRIGTIFLGGMPLKVDGERAKLRASEVSGRDTVAVLERGFAAAGRPKATSHVV